jgi:hypothetical protein
MGVIQPETSRQAGDSSPLCGRGAPNRRRKIMRLRASAFGAADTGSIPVGRIAGRIAKQTAALALGGSLPGERVG